ncbi:MAG TPA: hypothetical protein VGG39_05700 [Polyangiaceae bacterium]|jgi:hypothetical protein
MPTVGKGDEADLAVKLAAGTQKHLSTISTLIVGSGSFTPAQVEAQLQAFAALRTAVNTAKAAVEAALMDEETQGPALRAFYIAFIALVRSAFGNSPDVLADFGLSQKKARTPLTTVQMAAAAAKRKATRQARGTRGPKAKLSVKGNVTGVIVTPVTASPAVEPAQTASSASSAPTTGSDSK